MLHCKDKALISGESGKNCVYQGLYTHGSRNVSELVLTGQQILSSGQCQGFPTLTSYFRSSQFMCQAPTQVKRGSFDIK